jgi:hypothetical protein
LTAFSFDTPANAGAIESLKKWGRREAELKIAEAVITHEERHLLEGLGSRLATTEGRVALAEEVEVFAETHPALAGRARTLLRKYVPETKLNDAPYNARATERMIEDSLSSSEKMERSSTLPKSNQKNVKLAGKGKDIEIATTPEERALTGQTTKSIRVPFDNRGYPIFDKYAVYDTRLPDYVASGTRKSHFAEATSDLNAAMQRGEIPKGTFNKTQEAEIAAGDKKITGYTWHHDSDRGRMQLVPDEIHKKVGHIGGFSQHKG